VIYWSLDLLIIFLCDRPVDWRLCLKSENWELADLSSRWQEELNKAQKQLVEGWNSIIKHVVKYVAIKLTNKLEHLAINYLSLGSKE